MLQPQQSPQPQQSLLAPNANLSSSPTTAAMPTSADAPTNLPAPKPKDPVTEHEDLVKMIDDIDDQLKVFNSDATQKAFRINIKKQVNMKVSQIAANASSIQKTTDGLIALLQQNAQATQIQRNFLEVTLARRITGSRSWDKGNQHW